MTKARQQLGLEGERIAARYLLRQGLEFVEHRFRSGHRDVDLIFRSGDTIVFVEVKCRRSGEFGSPVESVHKRKQRELIKSARIWASRYGSDKMTYQFDVVGVQLLGQNARIRHIRNAFPVPGA